MESGLYQISSGSNLNVETRLVEIKSLIDGVEGSLGDAIAAPVVNTIQARLKAAVDLLATMNMALSAQKSPISSTTTAINVVPAGIQLVPAASANTLYRRITVQIDAINPVDGGINIITAATAAGLPRIKGMGVNAVYVFDYLGAVFANTVTTATVNVTVDTY